MRLTTILLTVFFAIALVFAGLIIFAPKASAGPPTRPVIKQCQKMKAASVPMQFNTIKCRYVENGRGKCESLDAPMKLNIIAVTNCHGKVNGKAKGNE